MNRQKCIAATILGLVATTPLAAQAHMMAAIDEVGNLVRFSDRKTHVVETFPITGTSARIVGIDVRGSTKSLYGVASDGSIYEIDSTNGRATLKARVARRLDRVGIVDFDPDDDRLYVVTQEGQAMRINVDTGEVVDLTSGSPGMFGASRNLTAGGFTPTQFFAVDSTQMALFHQPASPAAMTSTMRREISMTGGTEQLRGGDLYTEPNGNQAMYIVRGSRLFKIDVTTGHISLLGQVGTVESLRLIDVAVTQPE